MGEIGVIRFQSNARRPSGVSIDTTFSTAGRGCTQWNDCANTTRSKVRPAGCHSSNVPRSTSTPLPAATLAMRASGSMASTFAPASSSWTEAMPVPAPTSSARMPGRGTNAEISAPG